MAIKTVCDAPAAATSPCCSATTSTTRRRPASTIRSGRPSSSSPTPTLDLPIYAVLGNHDYGGQLIIDAPGVGNEWDKGPIEVDVHGGLRQVGDAGDPLHVEGRQRRHHRPRYQLDPVEQRRARRPARPGTRSALAEVADTDWKIVAGHHPYRSNGQHGNAGNYDAPELVRHPDPQPAAHRRRRRPQDLVRRGGVRHRRHLGLGPRPQPAVARRAGRAVRHRADRQRRRRQEHRLRRSRQRRTSGRTIRRRASSSSRSWASA